MSKHRESKRAREGRERLERQSRDERSPQREKSSRQSGLGDQVATASKPPSRPIEAPPVPATQPDPVAAKLGDSHDSGVSGGSRVVYVSQPPDKVAQERLKRKKEKAAERVARQTAPAGVNPSQTSVTPVASVATPLALASPAPAQAGPEGSQVTAVADESAPAQTVIEPIETTRTGMSPEELWQSVIPPNHVSSVKVKDIILVDPGRVLPDPNQVRRNFSEEKLAETAESISQEGQKEPAKIYRISGDPDHDWMILDGQRRWTCCIRVGVPLLAQVVPVPISEIEKLGDQVTLNTGEGHDHMEIILAIQVFIRAGKDIPWIARKFVKSQTWVQNYVRTAALPGLVIDMLSSALPDNERLRFPVALLLLKFPSQYQLGIAEQVRGKAMSEASRIINRELGEAEPETGGRKRQPKDDRSLLERALDGTIAGFRQLGDMSDEQFARMRGEGALVF